MNPFINFFSIFSLSVLLYSCTGKQYEDKHTEKVPVETVNVEEGSEHHEDQNIAVLTQEQVKTIGLEIGSIESKELTNVIKANGYLKVPNQNKGFVTPLYDGVIRTLSIQPGQAVKKGQIIATIANPAIMQIQQQLQQVKTQLSLTQIEVNRQKELVEGNASPLKKLQQVEAELKNLQVQQSSLQKQLNTIGATEQLSETFPVRAPLAGSISKIIAQIGSNVNATTPIAEIINNSQLHLDLLVYEKDLSKLKVNQAIHFVLTNVPGKEYDATIFAIGSAFETDTKTVPIHAHVEGNKVGLIDGMNITASISLNKSKVLAIPNDAIITVQGQDFIFKVLTPTKDGRQRFEKIPVVRGTSDIGFTEITLLKDQPDNTKYVTKGAFFVLAKLTNIEGDEH